MKKLKNFLKLFLICYHRDMNFLEKRETPVQNIAYIGIMAAINVVFVLISSLLPVLFFLLVFILPLTSVIVTIYCKKLYFPIYFVTTLALCLAVTAGFSIFDTFIYVLPSLIVGFVFGISIEKNIPAIYVLIINSIILYALTYLTFLFIDRIIGEVSFFDSIYRLVGLETFQYKAVLTHIFTYIVAQIQVVLTYILVKYQANRMDYEINLKVSNRFIMYILTFIGATLTILSVFFFPEVSMLLVLIVLPITVYELIDLVMKKTVWIYVSLGVTVIGFMFLFAFLYQFIPAPNGVTLIYVFFGLVTIIDLISNYCLKNKVADIE